MILATGFCGERNALMAVIGLSFMVTSFDIDVSENLPYTCVFSFSNQIILPIVTSARRKLLQNERPPMKARFDGIVQVLIFLRLVPVNHTGTNITYYYLRGTIAPAMDSCSPYSLTGILIDVNAVANSAAIKSATAQRDAQLYSYKFRTQAFF